MSSKTGKSSLPQVDENPPILLECPQIEVTVGMLREGITLTLTDEALFNSLVRDRYEQFLFQPAVYKSETGLAVTLPTGVRLAFNWLFEHMNGEIGLITRIIDNSGGQTVHGLSPPDMEDFAAYEWRKVVRPGEFQRYDVPKPCLQRYTSGPTVYRSGDLPPCTIYLKEIGQITGLLGPSGEPVAADQVVCYIQPMYGVRPFGSTPLPHEDGAYGLHSQDHSFDAAISSLGLNIRTQPMYPASYPLAVGMGKEVGKSRLLPIVLDTPLYSLIHSFPADAWPSLLGKREDAQAAYSSGKRTAALVLYVLIKGEGEYATLLHNTQQVLESIGQQEADELAWSTRDQAGDLLTQTFSAPATMLSDELVPASTTGGSIILDTVKEVALFAFEFLLAIAAKRSDSDNNHNYSKNNGKSWPEYVTKELPYMLEYAASQAEGEYAASILTAKEILDDSRVNGLGVGSKSGYAAELEFFGFYTGAPATAGSIHHHLTSDEHTEINSKLPDSKTITLNVIDSPIDPHVQMLAPVQLQLEAGVPFQPSRKVVKSDYVGNPRLGLLDGLEEPHPIYLVTRYHTGEGATATNLRVMCMYDAAKQVDGISPIIHRTAFPFQGGEADTTILPFRDPSDPSQNNRSYIFTGHVIGKFDQDFVVGADDTEFDVNPFLGTNGVDNTDIRRHGGYFSGMISGSLPPFEAADYSGGNVKDTTHRFFGELAGGQRWEGSVVLGSQVLLDNIMTAPWTNTGYVLAGTVQIVRAPAWEGPGLLNPSPKALARVRKAASERYQASLRAGQSKRGCANQPGENIAEERFPTPPPVSRRLHRSNQTGGVIPRPIQRLCIPQTRDPNLRRTRPKLLKAPSVKPAQSRSPPKAKNKNKGKGRRRK